MISSLPWAGEALNITIRPALTEMDPNPRLDYKDHKQTAIKWNLDKDGNEGPSV
jgi:hypothetical protein